MIEDDQESENDRSQVESDVENESPAKLTYDKRLDILERKTANYKTVRYFLSFPLFI